MFPEVDPATANDTDPTGSGSGSETLGNNDLFSLLHLGCV